MAEADPQLRTRDLRCLQLLPRDYRHAIVDLFRRSTIEFWSSVFMKDERSCRSSKFDELRDAHVSQDLIVVVVAKKACFHHENGLHIHPDDGDAAIVEPP